MNRRSMKVFTGYHGTTELNGRRILKEKQFNLSNGNKEWLGKGIYFYEKYIDAFNWTQGSMVLHSIIEVEDDQYIDIDTEEGKKTCRKIMKYIFEKYSDRINEKAQENQCQTMNFMWETSPRLRLIFASFSSEKSKYNMLIDVREKRREFCVRSNEVIKSIQTIERVK